jgi:radical SAM superfamily enzyme YgiQ (UPF0313 family)
VKILFIKPPRGKGFQTVDVPLAFMYLSSYLKRYLGKPVDVEMLDLRLTRKTGRALVKKLTAFQPDLIGISLLTEGRNFVNQWSGFLKKNAPKAEIVIGGPAATLEYRELLMTNRAVQWAVVGEGETVFLNLVRSLIEGRAVNDVKGLAYVDGSKVVCNPLPDFIQDLDTVPFPDYSLLNLSDYIDPFGSSHHGFLAERRYTTIISSRGCPFHCIYCHDIFGKKVRQRSPENFVAEIQWLYDEYGIREFHISDDIFNYDRKRMQDILNLIIASDMNIKLAFPNGLRADMLEKEDIALLQRAGAYALTFAIESASPRLQKVIKKKLNIPKVVENIEYAERIGLIVRGFFMLGFPGETTEELQSTITFAKESSLDLASFFIVTPFKGTALYELVKSTYPGLSYTIQGNFWDYNSFYPLATGFDIKKAQTRATLKFYFPFRVFKVVRKFPNKLHLVKFIFDFFRILVRTDFRL